MIFGGKIQLLQVSYLRKERRPKEKNDITNYKLRVRIHGFNCGSHLWCMLIKCQLLSKKNSSFTSYLPFRLIVILVFILTMYLHSEFDFY